MTSQTLLHVLSRRRQWTYRLFVRAYEDAAATLADRLGDGSIATATVSEQTFRRWTAGQVKSLPQWPAPLVLEELFGVPVDALLGPPPAETASLPSAPVMDESELRMTAQDAADHAGEAAAMALPELTIDQVEDDVRHLAQNYLRVSPADSYRRGTDLLRVAQALLSRTQRPRQRERLYLQAVLQRP